MNPAPRLRGLADTLARLRPDWRNPERYFENRHEIERELPARSPTGDTPMTTDNQALAADLLQRAVDGTDEPARAASVLVTAAATILQRHFGEERAIELLHHGLDVAGAEWRRVHAH